MSCRRVGLKRMGFPFGIETEKWEEILEMYPRLKRMGFPFGIETMLINSGSCTCSSRSEEDGLPVWD